MISALKSPDSAPSRRGPGISLTESPRAEAVSDVRSLFQTCRLQRSAMPIMRTNHEKPPLADSHALRSRLPSGLLAAAVFLSPAGIRANEENRRVFEAEDVSSPSSAWVRDKHGPDHWNLWSKDKDAAMKWSGGTVLQSPVVKADRATPEEGAPPLKITIPGLKPGRYSVELKTGRVLALSRDGKDWEPFHSGMWLMQEEIKGDSLTFWVDDRFADKGNPGSGYFDTVTLTQWQDPARKPKVEGHAGERVRERLGRGLVAIPSGKGTYFSWRLLEDDPADIAFHVYQSAPDGSPPVRLTGQPVRTTTDFQWKGPLAPGSRFQVRGMIGANELDSSEDALMAMVEKDAAFLRIPLDEGTTVQRVGIADLDGDGVHELVLKTPNSNIDPWHKYWKPSPGTYQIEARTVSGKLLWRNDLGWGIEQGIWYSPWITHDLDGDGMAEVAAKIGEGDPREKDGKVRSGPEWLVVWDGTTGRERARVPWPDRSGFGEGEAGYNHASRNQMAIAYLDGRTPCLVALRGTYGTMKAEAWAFDGKALRLLWKYADSDGGPAFRGQGAHTTHAVDIDGDGRDEIILGSAVIDDNGTPLWSTGMGHPDHLYVGDLDPLRPGLEIYYGIETRARKGGMCMVDARNGQMLWQLDQPTKHVHSFGLCSDIDPAHPGAECYGADSADHKPTGDRWQFSAQGKLLSREVDFGFGVRTAHWDADHQRELLSKGQFEDFGGARHPGRIEGGYILTADVLGDWREEILVSRAGELRIYLTEIPARDRRVALLQDRFYRSGVTMNTMGYTQVPMLSYDLATTPVP
jgi:rhamnogalacturonan endolyase